MILSLEMTTNMYNILLSGRAGERYFFAYSGAWPETLINLDRKHFTFYIYISLWISTSHIIPIKVSKNIGYRVHCIEEIGVNLKGEATGGHLIYCSYQNIASGLLCPPWQTQFYFQSAHLSPSTFIF